MRGVDSKLRCEISSGVPPVCCSSSAVVLPRGTLESVSPWPQPRDGVASTRMCFPRMNRTATRVVPLSSDLLNKYAAGVEWSVEECVY